MAMEKISMKFAQMFGTAKEADSVMEEYKKRLLLNRMRR